MKQEFVTLPRSVVEQVFYHLIRGDADAVCWADGVIKPALEQPQRKLTPQDIADSALLGNIESPFNACMHQEHCKRWKAQADQQHQGELSSDNDLQCENSHLITTSSSVPFGYKPVPMEPTEEMLRAGCGSESPAMFRESLRRETDGQKTVEMVEKIIQRNLNSYRAMLDAAPQPPAFEQQVEREPVAVVDFTTGGWRKIVDAMRTLPDGAQLYTHPQARHEPLANEQARSIYNSATYSASLAVFMTRMDAENPDADDKGVSGWLQEAEDRVKRSITESAHNIK